MKERVRVIHLSASDSGGAYVFAHNLVTALAKKQDIKAVHKVYTGKSQNISITGIKPLDSLIKTGLHAMEKLVFLFFERGPDIRFKFSLGYPGMPFRKLRRMCRDYDIIHLHWINKGFIKLKHLEKLGKPVVWTCHDIWPVTGGCHLTYGCENYRHHCGRCPMLKRPSPHDLSYHLFNVKEKVYSKLDLHFVSPSKWMKENTVSSALGKEHTHYKINNGINTAVFKYTSQVREDKRFCIGFVAANLNDENKALHRLVEALNMLENKSEYRLILIGQQKHAFDFEVQVEHKVYDHISDPAEMAELYNEMDLLAVTSTLETFPTTLMEAACCGAMTIGFDVGGVKEIIEQTTGLLVLPYDTHKLAEGIVQLKNSRSDKAGISAHAISTFSIETTAAHYQELYQSIF